jgi:hypothetical protein
MARSWAEGGGDEDVEKTKNGEIFYGLPYLLISYFFPLARRGGNSLELARR